MSPNGFVNTTSHVAHHYPHHGFSLPSHSHQPQVTMNINMNMYPNVMNINMGSVPSYNQPINQQPIMNHSATQNKQFQYNDFFTGNINPPPQVQNITLDTTLSNNQEQDKK